MKPIHFPPLPNQQQQQSATDELSSSSTTSSTTTTIPAPPTRSVADIVKSTVVVPTKPKNPIPVETVKEAEVFPTLCQTTTKDLKSNSFSYADMLKKKDN